MIFYAPNLVQFVRDKKTPPADLSEMASSYLLTQSHLAFGRQIIHIAQDAPSLSMAYTQKKVKGSFFAFLLILAAWPVSLPLIQAGLYLRRRSISHKSVYASLVPNGAFGMNISKKLLYEFVLLYLRIKPLVQRALGLKIDNRYDLIPVGDTEVLLGALPLKNDIDWIIKKYRPDTVISVTEPFENDFDNIGAGWFQRAASPSDWEKRGILHKQLVTADLHEVSEEHILEGVAILDEQIKSGKKVFVHCKAGMGRSAMIVIAYLMSCCMMTFEKAYCRVKSHRPQVLLFDNQKKALQERR